MSAYKAKNEDYCIADAVSDAFSEWQALRDEMREWADNLDGGNLGLTGKYEQVNECADNLENFCDNEPEILEGLGAVRIQVTQMVPSSKRRGPSRATRCSNAVMMLRAVIEKVVELKEAAAEKKDDEQGPDYDTFESELQNAVDEAEACEFPGMYG